LNGRAEIWRRFTSDSRDSTKELIDEALELWTSGRKAKSNNDEERAGCQYRKLPFRPE